MKLSLYQIALPLAHEFTISRGSLTSQPSLIVELSDGEQAGLGEVTANPYYGHTLDSISQRIESVRETIERFEFGTPEDLIAELLPEIGDDTFALCAVDLAVHDLYGRKRGRALVDLWGLDRTAIPDSSYTIGIDTIETMVAKLNEKSGWSCYKIKLGTPNDLNIVRALRDATDATLRIDANCGWSAEETVEKSHALKELGVEFIEQPLPADADESDMRHVFENSALPVIADENCIVEADVDRCRGLFHGVNVKLCKCGGLTPALRMLRRARELGMKTMVGCMVESSIGISAAAQLLPLLDYADLDGAVLLKDEPARGVAIDHGRVKFADLPGTGAELLHDRLPEFQV